MELKHIDIANLSVSSANMRAKGKTPDLTNILPSVRARGVLVPLIVRANGSPDTFEIVAGKRRYHAALAVAQETGEAEPLPCAIMAAGDDAAALEASLIENIARLDADEVTRWESFTRLVREGRSPEDIALTFGLTELQVKRTLALGNLLPRIRSLYRKGEIDAATVKHLTLASKARQRDWLALLDDPESYCPTGSQLKAWAFGGASIPASAALFDLAGYPGEIVSDLFGDERYFASAEQFWTAQAEAIEVKAASYREAGWSEVVVLPTGEPFHTWEHERTPRRKGGKVFIAVGTRGDVAVHEGYLTLKEARRRESGDAPVEKPVRPEIGSGIQNYIDLHRHAAVRAAVAVQPSVALRLMVAHAIAGSSPWRVSVEPQRATSDAIAESVENSASEAAFDERRRAVLSILGFDPDTQTVTGGYDGDHGISGLFVRLLALSDEAVGEVLAIVMAETLEAGSVLIETLGIHLGIDMAPLWQADDALLDLIRDREVLGCVLSEVAGDDVAAANEVATGKVARDHPRLPHGRERQGQGRGLGAPMDGVPAIGLHRTWWRRQRRACRHHRRPRVYGCRSRDRAAARAASPRGVSVMPAAVRRRRPLLPEEIIMTDPEDRSLKERAAEAFARSTSHYVETPPDTIDPAELAKLERAVKSLRRRDREIFLAHRLDDMSYGEIAERTGLTVKQVERAMSRALSGITRHVHRPERRWWFWPF